MGLEDGRVATRDACLVVLAAACLLFEASGAALWAHLAVEHPPHHPASHSAVAGAADHGHSASHSPDSDPPASDHPNPDCPTCRLLLSLAVPMPSAPAPTAVLESLTDRPPAPPDPVTVHALDTRRSRAPPAA